MVFGMMDSFGRAIKKVDSFMDKDGVVQTQLNWFEARTRVKKRYILAGCLILTGWLMFGLLAPFVVSLVSFVYPAIQSVKGTFYYPHCVLWLASDQSYKAWVSFIVDLFSDIHKLSLSMLILNSQCVGVAREVNNKRAPGLIT